jgi:hypothetical protein
MKSKICDAVVILLESNSKDIVYFCLGILINLTLHNEIKTSFGQNIFCSAI